MGKIAVILCFLLLTSCGVTKRNKETTTTSVEKTETNKDSSSKVSVNKEINDAVSTQVTNSGDPLLDAKVDEILSRLNTTKSSGDNSYRFYYDSKLRELKAEFQVAKTQDSITNTSKDVRIEKTFEEQISEYVKKIIIPWWMYLIAVVLLWRFISPIVFFIFPQLKGLKTLKDITTPPNPKT